MVKADKAISASSESNAAMRNTSPVSRCNEWTQVIDDASVVDSWADVSIVPDDRWFRVAGSGTQCEIRSSGSAAAPSVQVWARDKNNNPWIVFDGALDITTEAVGEGSVAKGARTAFDMRGATDLAFQQKAASADGQVEALVI